MKSVVVNAFIFSLTNQAKPLILKTEIMVDGVANSKLLRVQNCFVVEAMTLKGYRTHLNRRGLDNFKASVIIKP
jgi:hypothetical protein